MNKISNNVKDMAKEDDGMFSEKNSAMKKTEEKGVLKRLSKEICECNDITQISELLMDVVESIFPYKACSVYLLDERINQFGLMAHKNFSKECIALLQLQIEEGIIDWAIRGKKPKVIENVFDSSSVRSLIICPFISRDRVLGTFIILSENMSSYFSSEQLTLLELLCKHTSVYIENIKLSNNMERKLKQLSLLFETSKNINSVLDLQALLKTIMYETEKELGAQMGYLLLSEGDRLVLKISRSAIPYKKFKEELPIGHGVSGWVAKQKKPLLITDYPRDPRFKKGNEFDGFRVKTVISVPIISKGDLIGVITLCNKKEDFPFTKEDLEMTSTLADQAGIAITNAKLFEDLEMGYLETISALAAAIEAKDPYTRGHSQRVMNYCMAIANAMNLPDEQKKIIQYSAVLHDVGKIGISDSIIGKPSPLDDKEFKTIKKHPEIGDEIASTITFLEEGRELIRHHHERYDGNGYPDGLKGEEISLVARIAAVADSYDAMATNRPYDKPWSKERAIARLIEVAGSQLDSNVVEVFVGLLRENKV